MFANWHIGHSASVTLPPGQNIQVPLPDPGVYVKGIAFSYMQTSTVPLAFYPGAGHGRFCSMRGTPLLCAPTDSGPVSCTVSTGPTYWPDVLADCWGWNGWGPSSGTPRCVQLIMNYCHTQRGLTDPICGRLITNYCNTKEA